MTESVIQWIKWLIVLMVPAIVVGSVTLAAQTVTSEGVRNRISQKIRSKYQVKNLQIQVLPFTSDYWTQRGRFKAIVISADILTRKSTSIRNIYVKAFDVTLDIPKLYEEGDIETTSRRSTALSARLYKSDLNKLLAKKESGVTNLHIEFENNRLVLTATYQLIFGHNLRMVGRLELKDHRRVDFVPTAASANGIPLPAGPLRQVLSKLNPLIDFHELPLQPRVEKIEIRDEYILVTG